ncbi:MAG: hypothetical protein WAT65_09435 [Candidatus Nanopelagicales bacterium]
MAKIRPQRPTGSADRIDGRPLTRTPAAWIKLGAPDYMTNDVKAAAMLDKWGIGTPTRLRACASRYTRTQAAEMKAKALRAFVSARLLWNLDALEPDELELLRKPTTLANRLRAHSDAAPYWLTGRPPWLDN